MKPTEHIKIIKITIKNITMKKMHNLNSTNKICSKKLFRISIRKINKKNKIFFKIKQFKSKISLKLKTNSISKKDKIKI